MGFNRPLILLGAGGHASVLLDIIIQLEGIIEGVSSPDLQTNNSTWNGIQSIKESDIQKYDPSSILLVNAVGSLPRNNLRSLIYTRWKDLGYSFATIIHPSALISKKTALDEGCQIMAGAILQPGTHVGANSIINTKSSVDHDTIIGKHCHLAPGTTICGNVQIGDYTHIGVGANIAHQCKIGTNSLIGAGTTVIRDIPDTTIILGAKNQPQKSLINITEKS